MGTRQSLATAALPRSPGAADHAGQLLRLLREGTGQTTSELAAALGMARSTTLQRIEALSALGLVEHTAAAGGGRGRPAVLSRFNPDAAVVLAAHVGMTGFRVAVVDLAGVVLADAFVATAVSGGADHLLGAVTEAFDSLLASCARTRSDVAGVGLGLPSAVDLLTFARTGEEVPGDWDRTRVGTRLRRSFHAPVFVDLDVNLLALAERRKSWPDHEVFVCVKLGTLIDAAIVVNGVPVHGVNGRAGELGHVKVGGAIEPCSCGGLGCLDAVASGSAVVRQLAAAGEEVTHVSQVVALAQQGHPGAVGAVRAAGRHIGTALSSVVNLLNPGVIAVWGYLADAEATLFAGIREGLYQAALPSSSESLALVRTSLGQLTGVRGAAALVIDQVLAPEAVDRLLVSGSWSGAWPVAD